MGPFISAEQFSRVYALLRQERKIHTEQRAAIRRFLEAVFWVGRSGAQWRLLAFIHFASIFIWLK